MSSTYQNKTLWTEDPYLALTGASQHQSYPFTDGRHAKPMDGNLDQLYRHNHLFLDLSRPKRSSLSA